MVAHDRLRLGTIRGEIGDARFIALEAPIVAEWRRRWQELEEQRAEARFWRDLGAGDLEEGARISLRSRKRTILRGRRPGRRLGLVRFEPLTLAGWDQNASDLLEVSVAPRTISSKKFSQQGSASLVASPHATCRRTAYGKLL